MKRRDFIAAGAALATGAALAPLPAFAASTADAVALVERVSRQVIDLINASGSTAQKEAGLRSILQQSVALRDVAGFALGRYARGMDAAQRDVYVQVYTDYVARVYTGKFGEYSGETITVSGAQDVGDKGVYVNSTVNSKGQIINIGWLVRADRSGALKVTDIDVDGLSMAQSQRSEFTRMIAELGGNLSAFIDRLRTLGG